MAGWTFRKAHLWLSLTGLAFLMLFGAVLLTPHSSKDSWEQHDRQMRRLVEDLSLTDLCLFTDARYLRHLSQADIHAPFQDNPAAFDYFPSGSLVLPPVSSWGIIHELDTNPD